MPAMPRRLFLAALAALSLAACAKGGGGVSGSTADEMSLGDPKAKVSVIEYASASCPHCARFNNEVFPDFKKKYIDTGKIHYTYREFLTPPVEVAAAGFLLSRCVAHGDPQKYFQVLDAIYRSQEEMFAGGDTTNVRPVLLRIAQSFGLNEDQFTKCITDDKSLQALNDRVQKFVDQDHIEATPTFVINGKKVKEGEVSLAELDADIQPLLK
ncbi:MAG: DsbA family protein [Caulobacteraceae bacterium]